MSEKQDRQGARTPADLERKWQFGKRFAEIMGIATDAQNSVSVVESSLHNEILEQVTSITRDVEQIVLAATASYVETTELEELRGLLSSELAVMADKIAMNFEASIEHTNTVDGELQTTQGEIEKHFEFNANGLTIKAGESEMKLRIDNDVIAFYKGDIDENDLEKNRFGWWDGSNFYTGNIFVELEHRAQLGNFAFIPRSNGSLDFLKVGG